MVFGDAVESFVGVPVMQFPPAARKFLSSFDTDGNGVIDMGELEHAARLLGDARKGNLTVEQFPERLRDTVRALDDEGNGVLEIDEIAEMVEMYAAVKEANKRGEIDIKTLPKEIQPSLKVFDVDGDGTVAPLELARGAELYVESKKMVKKLTRLAVALLLLMGIMLAAITGLVFTVVELSKETSTDGSGVQTVKGTNESVKVASAETASVGGVSVDRETGKPAQVAPVLTPAPLTSRLDTQVFKDLRYFEVTSPTGAEVQLFVLGIARMERENSVLGTVIEMVTEVGHIVLDDELLYIEHEDGSAFFTRAGFVVSDEAHPDTGGRALLGVFELLGFFNAIDGLEPTTSDGSVQESPKLPDFFYSEMRVLKPCDGALYPAASGISPNADMCSMLGSDYPGVVDYDHDLDGIKTRWMQYTETSHSDGNKTIAATTYAHAPDFKMYELRDATAGLKWTWAERTTLDANGSAATDYYACTLSKIDDGSAAADAMNGDSPEKLAAIQALLDARATGDYKDEDLQLISVHPEDFEKLDAAGKAAFVEAVASGEGVSWEEEGDTSVEYTYEGTAVVNGRSTRVFVVNATEPGTGKYEFYKLYEYTDSDGNSRPVRFAFEKEGVGKMYNELDLFEPLASLPEDTFQVPAAFLGAVPGQSIDSDACPVRTTPALPVLDAPFSPEWVIGDNVTLERRAPEEGAGGGRRLTGSGNDAANDAMDEVVHESRRQLHARMEAGEITEADLVGDGLDSNAQLAAWLLAVERRVSDATHPDADPTDPNVIGMRHLMADGITLLENEMAFDVHVFPPCGPEIYKIGFNPDLCMELFAEMMDKAGVATGGIDISITLKFVLRIPGMSPGAGFNIGDAVGDIGAISGNPSTWPLQFDGFAITGEVDFTGGPGLLVAHAEAGWTGAAAGDGGEIYGEIGLTAGVLNMLPGAVVELLPDAIAEFLEQKLANARLSVEPADPRLKLTVEACIPIPVMPFTTCFGIFGVKANVQVYIDMPRLVQENKLVVQLADVGITAFYMSICTMRVPVYVPVLVWGEHCFKVFWSKVCIPYIKGIQWKVAFYIPVPYPCMVNHYVSLTSLFTLPGEITIFDNSKTGGDNPIAVTTFYRCEIGGECRDYSDLGSGHASRAGTGWSAFPATLDGFSQFCASDAEDDDALLSIGTRLHCRSGPGGGCADFTDASYDDRSNVYWYKFGPKGLLAFAKWCSAWSANAGTFYGGLGSCANPAPQTAYCVNGPGGQCIDFTSDNYYSSNWKNFGDYGYDSFKAYCASFEANGGTFRGGLGSCADRGGGSGGPAVASVGRCEEQWFHSYNGPGVSAKCTSWSTHHDYPQQGRWAGNGGPGYASFQRWVASWSANGGTFRGGEGKCPVKHFHCFEGPGGACREFTDLSDYTRSHWHKFGGPDLAGFSAYCGGWSANHGKFVARENGGEGKCPKPNYFHCFDGDGGRCTDFSDLKDFWRTDKNDWKAVGGSHDLAGFTKYCSAYGKNGGVMRGGEGKCEEWFHCFDGVGGSCEEYSTFQAYEEFEWRLTGLQDGLDKFCKNKPANDGMNVGGPGKCPTSEVWFHCREGVGGKCHEHNAHVDYFDRENVGWYKYGENNIEGHRAWCSDFSANKAIGKVYVGGRGKCPTGPDFYHCYGSKNTGVYPGCHQVDATSDYYVQSDFHWYKNGPNNMTGFKPWCMAWTANKKWTADGIFRGGRGACPKVKYYHCFEGAGANAKCHQHAAHIDYYDKSVPWRNFEDDSDAGPTLDGYKKYCSAWSANGGQFNGGEGACPASFSCFEGASAYSKCHQMNANMDGALTTPAPHAFEGAEAAWEANNWYYHSPDAAGFGAYCASWVSNGGVDRSIEGPCPDPSTEFYGFAGDYECMEHTVGAHYLTTHWWQNKRQPDLEGYTAWIQAFSANRGITARTGIGKCPNIGKMHCHNGPYSSAGCYEYTDADYYEDHGRGWRPFGAKSFASFKSFCSSWQANGGYFNGGPGGCETGNNWVKGVDGSQEVEEIFHCRGGPGGACNTFSNQFDYYPHTHWWKSGQPHEGAFHKWCASWSANRGTFHGGRGPCP